MTKSEVAVKLFNVIATSFFEPDCDSVAFAVEWIKESNDKKNDYEELKQDVARHLRQHIFDDTREIMREDDECLQNAEENGETINFEDGLAMCSEISGNIQCLLDWYDAAFDIVRKYVEEGELS